MRTVTDSGILEGLVRAPGASHPFLAEEHGGFALPWDKSWGDTLTSFPAAGPRRSAGSLRGGRGGGLAFEQLH